MPQLYVDQYLSMQIMSKVFFRACRPKSPFCRPSSHWAASRLLCSIAWCCILSVQACCPSFCIPLRLEGECLVVPKPIVAFKDFWCIKPMLFSFLCVCFFVCMHICRITNPFHHPTCSNPRLFSNMQLDQLRHFPL